MPIYEYKCRECSKISEIFSKTMHPQNIRCAFCQSRKVEKVFSVPGKVQVTGGRKSGQTCCGREERCDHPPCESGEACGRS